MEISPHEKGEVDDTSPVIPWPNSQRPQMFQTLTVNSTLSYFPECTAGEKKTLGPAAEAAKFAA